MSDNHEPTQNTGPDDFDALLEHAAEGVEGELEMKTVDAIDLLPDLLAGMLHEAIHEGKPFRLTLDSYRPGSGRITAMWGGAEQP